MSTNCFCHFNGYEVKDANARANIETLTSEQSVLSSRVNNLTANSGASTEGNAELIDIRVGYDGTIYNTAGEAVRFQTEKLAEEKATILTPIHQDTSTKEWSTSGFIFTDYSGLEVGHTYMIIIKVDHLSPNIAIRGYSNSYNGNVLNLSCKESNGVYYYYGVYTPIADENKIYFTPNYNNTVTTVSQLFIYENTIDDEDTVHFIMGNNGSVDGYINNPASYSAISELSYTSEHSNTSDKAFNSDYSIYAQNKLTLLGELTSDDFTTHLCTIDSVVDNVVTCSDTTTYGAPGILYPSIVGNSYLVIWTGAYFWLCGFMINSGSGWNNFSVSTVVVGGEKYYYSTVTPTSDDRLHAIYFNNLGGKTGVEFKPISITQLDVDVIDVTDDYVASCIKGNKYNIATELDKLTSSTWSGKKVLFMGDSLTSANQYQSTVSNILGIEYENHSLGGAGIIQIVDGNSAGTISPITASDVADKDLIVFYAGYNNRGWSDGVVGDCYDPDGSGQSTIAGLMQYAINRIYECLAEAENLTCKILIVTVDCAGKYNYIDADGYDEYPAGSGLTMETLANTQKAVAEYNSLACCDLWHTSGINRNTWSVFGANSEAYIENPTNTDTPYPHNGDQLHKSDKGYQRIGEVIAGAIIKHYGN